MLLAAVLLGAILVPLFGSLHTGIQGTERVSEESVAANHAVALLERITQVPYHRLPEVPPDTDETELASYLDMPGALPPVPLGEGFQRLVTVREVSRRTPDPADPANSKWGSLKLVRVSIRWRPDYLQRKSERTLSFETLVTDDREVF